jgi:Transposase, Mutator family
MRPSSFRERDAAGKRLSTWKCCAGSYRQAHRAQHPFVVPDLAHRDRVFDTRLGSLQLRIPKLRQGSYFPPFLEARKVSEKALIAVIRRAVSKTPPIHASWAGSVRDRTIASSRDRSSVLIASSITRRGCHGH